MTFNYPITITNIANGIKCYGWRNAVKPVIVSLETGESILNVFKIDWNNNGFIFNDTIIIPNISFCFLDMATNVQINISLRDSKGIRLTNYVCYDKHNGWIKHCPRCNTSLPLNCFDYNGRFTGEERDQSECSNCRGSY